jgi:hypothetical protein
MSLTTSRGNVTGTGRASQLQRDLGSVTIAGQQQSDGSFFLSVTYDENGTVATYSGHIRGSNELDGAWSNATSSSYSLTFKRQ